MTIVCDTSAITTLLKAGEAGLLRDLFGGVWVPQAVWEELAAFHQQLPEYVSLRRVAVAAERLSGTELLGQCSLVAFLREFRNTGLGLDVLPHFQQCPCAFPGEAAANRSHQLVQHTVGAPSVFMAEAWP